MKVSWDTWQEQVLNHQGNIAIRAGRQVGKSEVISEKAVRFAIDHPGTVTLIVAASQRQSSLLFEKIVAKLIDRQTVLDNTPTMTRANLLNGSIIYCLPTGRTGHYIRGFTVDLLIADEAAFIPEPVWLAIEPMMAVSQKMRGFGHMILISTPFGKSGYFFNAFGKDKFRTWHISCYDCKRIGTKFLDDKRRELSKIEFAQEYLGDFIDDFRQFFPSKLIKEQAKFIDYDVSVDKWPGSHFYLGIDLARFGGDEVAFAIVEELRNRLRCVKVLVRDRVSTTHTVGETQVLDEFWNFKRIFIDSGGLGGPVLDFLQEILGKRRVIGLDNSQKALFVEGVEKRNRILKEDLYSNTLMLLERDDLHLIADNRLLRSLRSITFEYTSDRNLRLFGKYSHLTEALVRACWCVKHKGLSLYVH